VGDIVCDDSVPGLCNLDDLFQGYSVAGVLEKILRTQNDWSETRDAREPLNLPYRSAEVCLPQFYRLRTLKFPIQNLRGNTSERIASTARCQE
jgi:hypothetical protein